MPQRNDCGCSGLVTPTLDELLAVAHSKPLPRLSVRERRPPPAVVGAGMRGWMRWGLIDRAGREVRGGEGPNLILDQGLDLIATTALLLQQGNVSPPPTFFPLVRYCAVGTDSTAPAASDTGLGSELSRTDATHAPDEFSRPSDGVYRITRHIEFDYAAANGNLTEVGFSPTASAGGNLFNRLLFLDGLGTPEVVTKTSSEKLRIAYTLEVTLSPTTWTAGAFTITGVGVVNGDYRLIGGSAPSGPSERCRAPDLLLFSAWARGELGGVTGTSRQPTSGVAYVSATDLSGVGYATDVSKTSDGGAVVARDTVARDAYVAGSFQRTGGSWRWDTAYGNLAPIRGFYAQGSAESYNSGINSCGKAAYAFDLDVGDEFAKDDEHTLTVGVPTVSWGRA